MYRGKGVGMEFRILGPLAVSRADGRPAALGGRKPGTLLAVLLLARGRGVPGGRRWVAGGRLAGGWRVAAPAPVASPV